MKHEKQYGVAVSGGPDSMLLLNVLSRWANLEGKHLSVFSFNHNLRKESLNEILFVEKECKKLKCNFIKIEWHEKPKTALMEKARVARYSQIAKKCTENDIKTLFLGHHADDIAETLSMRIINNSYLEGLCPIFELREIFSIKLFRPLLCFTKSQILQLNSKKNIAFMTDPSNFNDRYFRTRIRKILNKEMKLKYNLIKAASIFCNIRKFNEKFIKEKLKNYYFYRNEGFLEIKREFIKKYPKFLVFNFLRIAIFRLGSKKYFSKAEVLENLYFKALQGISITYSLGGCILVFNKKKVFIYREYNDLESEIQLLPSHNRLVWDNRFEIINNTNVSVKILPLGSILNNSFYKKNFKINKKKIKTIPFQVRKTLPAIFTLEGLLYVPHLNIYELNSLKVSIEVETIDFFDKKYDNII
jgi:tRNA(Ile)-lysidine synthase